MQLINYFRDLSIQYKLLLGFLLLTLLILPISFYTMHTLNTIQNNFTDLVDNSFPKVQALEEMKVSALKTTNLINNLSSEIEHSAVNQNTPTKINATKDKLLSYLEEIGSWQKLYQKHLSEKSNESSMETLSELRDKVVFSALNIFSVREKNSDRVNALLQGKLKDAQINLDRFIKFATLKEIDLLEQRKNEVLHQTKTIFIVTFVLNGIIMFFAILISLILTRLISKPIINLKNFAIGVTQENLNNRFLVTTKDEIGDLGNSVNTMLNNLSHAKSQLMDASRIAGMAEVATSILHNVGNVLNSVNTSVNIINETLEKSVTQKFQKIANILEENKDSLSEYLLSEKGKLIIPYITTLSQKSSEERVFLQAETQGLAANLQHINQVIAMQQAHGSKKDIIELVSFSDLINIVCELNKSKIIQSQVEITHNYSSHLVLKTVRPKLQQILINIIINAIDSINEKNNKEKKIDISVKELGENINISITDNGIGIPTENLIKIFSFGFTTKKKGHGYGVHNSAILTKELGGQLKAFSDGPGTGATFVLNLPKT